MAELLKGKPVADALTARLTEEAARLTAQGVTPTLAIVRVGERPEDISYEKGALKRCAAIGVAVRPILLPEHVSQGELLSAIHQINEADTIHGCLLFRPLSRHIDERAVCEALSPAKDVDGITSASLAGVFSNRPVGYPPCTAQACVELLDHYQIPLSGKRVALIGRSLVVGRPLSMLLLHRNATVTICHTRTVDLPQTCRGAEIVVAAAGQARMVGAEFLSPGQTVLDVGINVDAEGRLCGDVDEVAAEPVVAALTPVPGGIGAITTSVLASHVIDAARRAEARR